MREGTVFELTTPITRLKGCLLLRKKERMEIGRSVPHAARAEAQRRAVSVSGEHTAQSAQIKGSHAVTVRGREGGKK